MTSDIAVEEFIRSSKRYTATLEKHNRELKLQIVILEMEVRRLRGQLSASDTAAGEV